MVSIWIGFFSNVVTKDPQEPVAVKHNWMACKITIIIARR